MLSDAILARVAELLQIIAKARATVGLCNRLGEVEVCIGDVTPYLAGLDWQDSYLETLGDK